MKLLKTIEDRKQWIETNGFIYLENVGLSSIGEFVDFCNNEIKNRIPQHCY